VGEPLLDRILQIEGGTLTFTTVTTQRQDDCPACARVPAAQESG
jgi:hypothetical protein